MGSLSTLLAKNPTRATKELSFCSQKLAASWLGPQPASPGSSSKCDTARNQPVLPASCVMLRGKENQALVSAPVATSGHLLLRQICCAWGGDSAACGQEFLYLRAEAEPGASALPRQGRSGGHSEKKVVSGGSSLLCSPGIIFRGGGMNVYLGKKAGERPNPEYQVFIVTWEEN